MTGSLPEGVRSGVEALLAGLRNRPVRVTAARSAGGGCIHHAVSLETEVGPYFLKWNRGKRGSAFGAQARGLDALRSAVAGGGILVPQVLGFRDSEEDEPGWLLLEYLPPLAPGPDWGRRVGLGLAALHSGRTGPRFGWEEDNRIGSLSQPNPWSERWSDFWREARLGVQFRAAFRDRPGTAPTLWSPWSGNGSGPTRSSRRWRMPWHQ